ncbi:MAG: DUF4838 domain-containing protein [bacterium]
MTKYTKVNYSKAKWMGFTGFVFLITVALSVSIVTAQEASIGARLVIRDFEDGSAAGLKSIYGQTISISERAAHNGKFGLLWKADSGRTNASSRLEISMPSTDLTKYAEVRFWIKGAHGLQERGGFRLFNRRKYGSWPGFGFSDNEWTHVRIDISEMPRDQVTKLVFYLPSVKSQTSAKELSICLDQIEFVEILSESVEILSEDELDAVVERILVNDEQMSAEIVQNGKSDFVIYRSIDAPDSVRLAAQELQEYIRRATGAELKIALAPTDCMISLGDNPTARRLGLTTNNVPQEGYRIETRYGNLFILGQDTPDGKKNARDGFSRGTLNGTYTFLEKFVGVRWLLPGPDGEYVPKLTKLVLNSVSIQDAPDFEYRKILGLSRSSNVLARWCLRQKLGSSVGYSFGHSWNGILKQMDIKKHPEWWVMSGGKRLPPGPQSKFRTTHIQAREAFADVIKNYFQAHPEVYCHSISPSDGGGWDESPEACALDETDPMGNRSVVKRVLQLYSHVGNSVRKEFPNKILCGYVYNDFIFPSKEIDNMRLPPNVVIVFAVNALGYGYKLYNPEMRKWWLQAIDGWAKIAANLGYYDLMAFEQNAGAPNPVGVKLLKFVYPNLKKRGVKIAHIYGSGAWGHAAPTNYLLAKLNWNADLDIDATFNEFFDCAYGSGGRDISKIYRLIDDAMEKLGDSSYYLTDNHYKLVYAPLFPNIELLYLSAEKKIQDEKARKRLQMLGDNLIMLHWNLRTGQYLKDDKASTFYRTDAEIEEFIDANQDSFALQQPRKDAKATFVSLIPQAVKVTAIDASTIHNAEALSDFQLRRNMHLVVYAPKKSNVAVELSNVRTRGNMFRYRVVNTKGEIIKKGLIGRFTSIEFPSAAEEIHHVFLLATAFGQPFYRLCVKGAAYVLEQEKDGLHFLAKAAPAYFYVPQSVKQFHLTLRSASPGETAAAKVYDPSGCLVAEMDTLRGSVDERAFNAKGKHGFWKVVVGPAKEGYFDDALIKQGPELSGFFTMDPKCPLIVERLGQTK